MGIKLIVKFVYPAFAGMILRIRNYGNLTLLIYSALAGKLYCNFCN